MTIYTKQTWTDEVLAALAKYLVKNDSGTTVYSEAEISLSTEVSVAGTPVTAERMNHIEDGIEAVEAAIPVKATGAEAIAGTVDTKFVTPKALKDGGFVPRKLIGSVPHSQLLATNIKPLLTTGCNAQVPIEMPTYKEVYDYCGFPKTGITFAYANAVLPEDYTGGVIYAVPYWFHPATTVNFKVSFGISAVAIGDAGNMDVDTGTPQYSNDEGGQTNYGYIGPQTSGITIANTPAAGKELKLRFSRKTDDATNDTLAVTAYLKKVLIWYPVA